MSFTQAQTDLLDANRDLVEARRLFEVHFATESYYLAEGSTTLTIGGQLYQPAHSLIEVEQIMLAGDGDDNSAVMFAAPIIYRIGQITPALSLAHLQDEAEWRGAPVIQRLQLLVDGVMVGPPIHLHGGKIADIRRRETVSEDYFEVRVEGMFRDRNATLLGKYTDRDQQMRSPGDRGCEYAAQLAEGQILDGWLQG